ncbi:ABC transporter permease subunit [Lampropedia puyangensis]|uniref:ABC transporter permease subunit n=1 Tax=Lampropedia puyangensis TaxID=1330072 RepID=A0A4S8FCT2_9BURK|nr:ABC transporter permease subunit [Lampropedia puyangensis]THU05157.1 ABC transporter permease subunit [Lampropedia puyangensis]
MDALDLSWLSQRAGFQISESLLHASPDDSYAHLLLAGAANTLAIAAVAIPLATLLGTALGLLRLSRHALLDRTLTLLIEPIRNTPVLLQLFMWYALLLALPPIREAWQPLPGISLSNRGLSIPALMGLNLWPLLVALSILVLHPWLRNQMARWTRHPLWLSITLAALIAAAGQYHAPLEWSVPQLVGLGVRGGWTLSPELTTLLVGLSVFHASYISDVVRGAVLAVPAGQVQAGLALGMRWPTLAQTVIYPYAARVGIPPYANQCLMLLKNSTLAIAIGFQDLMAIINTTITQTGKAIEGMTMAMAFYLLAGMVVAALLSHYNHRINKASLLSSSGLRLGQMLATPRFQRATLFANTGSTALTLSLSVILAWLAWQSLQWGVLNATWVGDAQACRANAAVAAGACWALITSNIQLLMFGTIASGQRSQAAMCCALLAVVALVLFKARLHMRWRIAIVGLLSALIVAILQGIGPWPALPTVAWGGVLSTLTLALLAIMLSIPLAVALALLRKQGPWWLRTSSAGLIDAIRSIPLVVLLLVCSFWIPLFFKGDWSASKWFLALIALILHTSCMLAEVLRGALQAVPIGQTLAAKAMGMRVSATLLYIVLPQAKRLATPAALGVFVGAIKDTSLVAIIGVFDTLAAAKTVIADTGWRPYFAEVYLFAAAFYLLLCIPLAHMAKRT